VRFKTQQINLLLYLTCFILQLYTVTVKDENNVENGTILIY